jgi:hypothetical protein
MIFCYYIDKTLGCFRMGKCHRGIASKAHWGPNWKTVPQFFPYAAGWQSPADNRAFRPDPVLWSSVALAARRGDA